MKEIRRTVDDALPKWLHSRFLSAVDYIWQVKDKGKEETIKRVDNVWASGQFTDECEYGNHKVQGYPYFRNVDVDANGIRCASKSWKISEVKV